MNTTQIKYFLTAAHTLNFTEAAKKIYITQSALSQQISALEAELGMDLFVRNRNKIKLTPAGVVLLEELDSFMEYYDRILQRASAANEGCEGTLVIGILQGHCLSEKFASGYELFKQQYPNVVVEFKTGSLKNLREGLERRQFDVIYTMDWDVEKEENILYEVFEDQKFMLMTSKYHPMAGRCTDNLADLKDCMFVIPGETESVPAVQKFLDGCKAAGFVPKLKRASSMEEQILWMEAGVGIGNIAENAHAAHNSLLVTVYNTGRVQPFVLAWDKRNMNPTIPLFTDFMCSH